MLGTCAQPSSGPAEVPEPSRGHGHRCGGGIDRQSEGDGPNPHMAALAAQVNTCAASGHSRSAVVPATPDTEPPEAAEGGAGTERRCWEGRACAYVSENMSCSVSLRSAVRTGAVPVLGEGGRDPSLGDGDQAAALAWMLTGTLPRVALE
jgi:hypothetical protein